MNHQLTGLQFSKSERLVVVTLSYLFITDIVWSYRREFCSFLYTTAVEIQRQLLEEDRNNRQASAPPA